MRSATRRVWLYWLLLLLPAVGVGVVAVHLLRRERERIAAQSADAWESRRAAAEARAKLVVENIELLVGDVQSGLLDTLAAQPADAVESLASDWEAQNPLVKTVFVADASGELARPREAGGDDVQRGFVRRFGELFRRSAPWRNRAERDAVLAQPAAAPARRAIESNVAQVQSARRDVQELLKPRSYDVAASTPAPAADMAAAEESERSARRAELERAQRARMAATGAAQKRFRDTPVSVTRPRGWSAHEIDGRLHLLGWIQAEGGEIRGVEVDLASLVSRLGSALPAETAAGEGIALRDQRGAVMHQAGAVPPGGEPVITVPVSNALLPGWTVAAFLPRTYDATSSGGAFFLVGSILVGTFVAAILAGGSLLLWQARRSEAEAAQKTSFVANVSHEFKTPLTTIRLYAELLEQGRVRDAAQGGEYLRTIGRETQRLARLVNNALDFSRLEQGQKKFARQSVDLAAELQRVLDGQEPRLRELNMRLMRAFPREAVRIEADRDALEQIMLNLIDNAAKYGASGGEVLVRVEPRAAGGVEIGVADRGPGVPAEHRERIFEKFHRVDDALTAEKSGAGLGLSIARQLARGLGGELRCLAREGGGAEFRLELP